MGAKRQQLKPRLPTAPVGPQPAAQLRALIVDDDPVQLLMMGEVLRQRGFAVAEAADGVAAQQRFGEFRPNLVLLDIDMPERDGIVACAAIRAEAGDDIPIVMVTGLDDASSIHRAYAAGATDFIPKPINWPLFHYRVEAILAATQTASALVATDDKVHSLERLAPDMALLVSRNGTILQQLGRRTVPGAPDAATLDALWPKDVALMMRRHISAVLKTRAKASREFTLSQGSATQILEATFLPEARDRALLVVRQLSASTAQQNEVYRLAYYEAGTGLPNVNLFAKSADACIAAGTLQERRAAILCVAFNHLRDAGGVESSSTVTAMLKAIAAALEHAARNVESAIPLDGSGARVARVSAGHFAIVCNDVRDRRELLAAAKRLSAQFTAPLRVADRTYALAPSIGISLFPEDGRTVEDLLDAAREAAEDARLREGHRFYSDCAHLSTLGRLDFANELRWAIERRQLRLYYQPRIDLASGAIVAVEALLRWHHPLRGIVPLDELLPLAEATAMMVPLGDWVLNTACDEIGALESRALRVAVNLSPFEFAESSLGRRVAAALQRSGFSATRLELEVTERALRRPQDPLRRLEELKALGVRVLLDDFGTDLVSLATLSMFPIDALKIDMSFVHGSQLRPQDRLVCEVIVAMAHKLKLRAVAEGVETAEQQALLSALGCDELQGYVLGQPMPLDELGAFLAQRA